MNKVKVSIHSASPIPNNYYLCVGDTLNVKTPCGDTVRFVVEEFENSENSKSFDEMFDEYCEIDPKNKDIIHLKNIDKSVQLHNKDQLTLILHDNCSSRYLTGGKDNVTAMILALTKLREQIEDDN